jgi:serine/threonine-protein kinase HipA
MDETQLTPFFVNLLPEGVRLMRLFQTVKAGKENPLALLLESGGQTEGDLVVLPPDRTQAKDATLEIHEEINFTQLANPTGDPFATTELIAGVQDKISGNIAYPAQSKRVPAAILKLPSERFPRIIENEHFFLQVAKSCGLQVNRAEIITDALGHAGLLVHRFDRKMFRGKVVERYHVEDGAQLLNIYPGRKYDVSWQALIARFRQWAASPAVISRDLLQAYAFSYAIGNSDLHAKNVSLMWRNGVATLTPHYDLLTSLAYTDLDARMALKWNGKDDRFRANDFIALGVGIGVPERVVRGLLAKIVSGWGLWRGRVGEIGWEESTTQRVQAAIDERVNLLYSE